MSAPRGAGALRLCRCGHVHAHPGELVKDRCPDCTIPPCLHFVPQDGKAMDFEPVRELEPARRLPITCDKCAGGATRVVLDLVEVAPVDGFRAFRPGARKAGCSSHPAQQVTYYLDGRVEREAPAELEV